MAIFINEINIEKLSHLENIKINISDNNIKKNLIITGQNGLNEGYLVIYNFNKKKEYISEDVIINGKKIFIVYV